AWEAATGSLSLVRAVIYLQAIRLAASGLDEDYVAPDVLLSLCFGSLDALARIRLVCSAPNDAGRSGRLADGLPAREIRFEGVSFAYPGRDDQALRELNLVIRAGESLAIVGANGAGKTTVIKLLCRFYDPVEGRITVDGNDLQEVDPK